MIDRRSFLGAVAGAVAGAALPIESKPAEYMLEYLSVRVRGRRYHWKVMFRKNGGKWQHLKAATKSNVLVVDGGLSFCLGEFGEPGTPRHKSILLYQLNGGSFFPYGKE